MRSLADVNVSALVRRAGVGRATFYLHYDDLHALALDACAQIVRDGVEALHSWRGQQSDPTVVPEALVSFFDTAAAHGQLYRALLTAGGHGPLGELLHQELRARSQAEREQVGAPNAEVAASAVASAFTGMFADWVNEATSAPPAEIAQQVWRVLLAIHGALAA